MSRGLRQGCPLSPLLYVLVSETFAHRIRQEKLVRGIFIDRLEYKINSYADDTNFTVRDFLSVRKILAIYLIFKLASGATLKIAKTQLLLLGLAERVHVPPDLQLYLVDFLKVYSIYLSKQGFDIPENWQEVYEALQLQEYRVPTLELSYFGKVGTFMTYTLSKMWYRANLITPPSELIRRLECVRDRYLWFPSAKNQIKKIFLNFPPIWVA